MLSVPYRATNYNSKLLSILLLSFVFLQSWTDAFRISPWIPLYMVPLLGMLVIGIFSLLKDRKIPKSAFDWKDFILLMFLGLITLSAIIHPNAKSVNYLSAYTFVFVVEYFLFRSFLYLYVDVEKLLTVNAFAVLVVGMFCTFELLLQYYHSIDIQEWMFRTRPATATYLGTFSRSYGFATEPTIVAYYLNTMGPIAVWKILQWSKRNPLTMLINWLAIFLILVGFISTFSSAGYLFFLSSLLLATILVWRPKLTLQGAVKLFLLVGSVLLLVFTYIDVWTYYFADIFKKLSFDRDYISVSVRLDALSSAVDRFLANPLTGIGLGKTSSLSEGSAMNWYISILSEAGVLTFAVFFLFAVVTIFNISKSKIDARFPFVMGALAGFSHLASVSTFYNPFLWILLSLFFVYQKKYYTISRSIFSR